MVRKQRFSKYGDPLSHCRWNVAPFVVVKMEDIQSQMFHYSVHRHTHVQRLLGMLTLGYKQYFIHRKSLRYGSTSNIYDIFSDNYNYK